MAKDARIDQGMQHTRGTIIGSLVTVNCGGLSDHGKNGKAHRASDRINAIALRTALKMAA